MSQGLEMGLRDHQKSPWKWHLNLMIQFSVAEHHHRSYHVLINRDISMVTRDVSNRVGLRLMHVYHIYIMHYLYTYKQFKVGLIKIQHS